MDTNAARKSERKDRHRAKAVIHCTVAVDSVRIKTLFYILLKAAFEKHTSTLCFFSVRFSIVVFAENDHRLSL